MRRAPMDLLLLAPDVTWGGRTGDAVHLRELARQLARRGHAVRIIARSGPDGGENPSEDLAVHPVRSSFNLGVAVVRRPLVLGKLIRIVFARRPDVVYSRSFGDLAEAIAASALGVPLVYEVNGDAIAEREAQWGRRMAGPARAWAIRSARIGFGRARAIVAVTETLRRRLTEDFRVAADKIRVVPNAADAELFAPRPASVARRDLGLSADGPIVGFVGNLAPWQGIEYLLRAFSEIVRRHPEARAIIVGDGQDRQRLEALAQTLGVRERVRFAGSVYYEEVPLYVAATDICVAPMTRERLRSGSSAVKIHEYLACERPVVASRIPGLEFLETEDLGRLVPPEDSHALAAAIEAALSDERWRRAAGARGRAYVVRRAGWPAVAAAVEDVCRMAVAA